MMNSQYCGNRGELKYLLLVVLAGVNEIRTRRQQLDEHCYQTMRHSYQDSTMKNIRSQALIYNRFCELYGFEMFPADAWQMVRYARYVANTVTSYETVLNYLSGVRRLHELGGYPVPGPDEPNMKHLLRAIKRELAHPVKQAEPVTPDLLRRIYRLVDLTDVAQIVSYTALLVGFYLFLRKSNLVPDGKQNFNPNKQLTRADVQVGQNMILVVIKWSKTIQYKEKELLLPLLPAKDMTICPVFWLKLMLKKVEVSGDNPLFSIPEKGGKGTTPLTYNHLAAFLKESVERMGISSERYTLHGLRKGGACHALEVGLVGEDLKILGDWASDAYMRYLDLTLQRRVDNMVKFMNEL